MGLYRALLHLYPSAFRTEYGHEMQAVFAARRRDAGSFFAAAILWLETISDVLVTALEIQWDVLWRDLQYTVRGLLRSPGFAVTALSVTALGIGATTAAFSLADYVLLRNLSFPDADRLVEIWEDQSPLGYSAVEPSPPNYCDWKRMSNSFEAMAAFHGISVNMIKDGEPKQVEGVAVTSDLLPMVGARPMLGRIFSEEDDQAGAPGTVVLSNSAWKGRFGSDASVLGRKVLIDGEPYSIIGVMPPNFFFPRREVEIWTPARFKDADFEDRTNNWLWVLGKLRPGVSLAQARGEMRAIGAALAREFPKESKSVSVTVESLRYAVSSRSPRTLLLALLGASVCVLLIACTNLANLLLARALARRRELAVRTAIGAGRFQLVRQMLTESLLLGACGGVLGVGLATASLPVLSRLIPASLPLGQIAGLDGRVLLFAVAITTLTAVAFGVLPALRACAGIDTQGLREASRGGIGVPGERLRRILVVAEVSASVVLLISSGLLMRALECACSKQIRDFRRMVFLPCARHCQCRNMPRPRVEPSSTPVS